jgi:hypothetical protein
LVTRAARLALFGLLLIASGHNAAAQGATGPHVLDPRFGIAESLAAPSAMAELGAGWTRILLAWHHIQSNNPQEYWGFGRVFREPVLESEVNRGLRVAGVLQYTPTWAATDPSHGHRAVPRNLFLAYDDKDNYFGQFVYQSALRYAGRIDEWIIWNEPEFRRDEPGTGESYTWLGTEEEFAQLLKVGYLAVKRANPNARVSFPATSYWPDALMQRPQYYDRLLDILSRDGDAPSHNFYHDAVSINLYRNPDDIYRMHAVFKEIQARHGIDRPIWLTETNAMPSDDSQVPCAERHATDPWQTTQMQQAAFAVQSVALAAAAGYERIAWWRLVDGRPCVQAGLWGAVRDDGTWRPAAEALRTAIRYFSGFVTAQYVPVGPVYLVVFDRPGRQRVTVAWNAGGEAREVLVPRGGGSRARAVDMFDREVPLTADDSGVTVLLEPATAAFPGDPAGYYYIGGPPVLIVEDDVAVQN